MSLLFKNKNAISPDDRNVKIVSGYIRISMTGNVPQAIYDIIFFFYFIRPDEWDKNKFGPHMILDKETIQLKNKATYVCGSAILTNVINEGRYFWKFKINAVGNELNFGVWKCKSSDDGIVPLTGRFFSPIDSGYVIDAARGGLIDPNNPSGDDCRIMNSKYAKKCKEGDTVEVRLDLIDRNLRYIINGKDCGIAFDKIEKTDYKSAIFMYTYREESNCSITLCKSGVF